MNDLILGTPLYGPRGPPTPEVCELASHLIQTRLPNDLDVVVHQVDFVGDPPRPRVRLTGRDAEYFRNTLIAEFGRSWTPQELREGMIVRGTLKAVAKTRIGVFVDLGVPGQQGDALIRKKTLQSQLSPRLPQTLASLLADWGLQDHLPLLIRITHLDLIHEQIEAEIAEEWLEAAREQVTLGCERLQVTGVPRQTLKRVILKRGHYQDVVEVERLGVLENSVVLKRGTTAPGIAARIGPFLPTAELSMFRPTKIRKYFP